MSNKVYPPTQGSPSPYPVVSVVGPDGGGGAGTVTARDTDPGATGGGSVWIDTSGTAPFPQYVRTTDNLTWEAVGQVLPPPPATPDLNDVLAAGNDGNGLGVVGIGPITAFNNGQSLVITGSGTNLTTGAPAEVQVFPAAGAGHGGLRFNGGEFTVDTVKSVNESGNIALLASADAVAGADVRLVAGSGGVNSGAQLVAYGGTGAGNGRVRFYTDGFFGSIGQAVVADGSNKAVWGGIFAIAAGVPAGPPTGALPIAVDTTAVTGGIYIWNGFVWVKAATI